MLAFIRAGRLIADEDRLVAAVSGGPDSVCMLSILVRLQSRLNLSLHIAHLNHRLRGADSDGDADYVAGLARWYGLPATVASRDVRAYQHLKHLSLEEAARDVRYAFLAEVVAASGSRAVMVGHTRNDNIETILMHLVRGSGSGGLRGLLPVNLLNFNGQKLRVVRPILELTREETIEYCREMALAPRVDATNSAPHYLRNRVRLELMPLLKSYNPRVEEALLRTAAISADEVEFLETETRRAWTGIAKESASGIVLDRTGLLSLPPALQRNLLRCAVLSCSGTLKDFESGHIEDMLLMLGRKTGKRLELPYGLYFCVEHDRFILVRDQGAFCPFPGMKGESLLRVPGETLLPGWNVVSEITDPTGDFRSGDPFAVHLDLAKTGDSILVRARRSCDVFQPLGMPGLTKVKDFMINARIPVAWRCRVPLFVSDKGIIWVGGYRIDERMKVTPATRKILRLRMERRNND